MSRRSFLKSGLSVLTFGLFESRVMAEVGVASPLTLASATVYGIKRNQHKIIAVTHNLEWAKKAAAHFTLGEIYSWSVCSYGTKDAAKDLGLDGEHLLACLKKCGVSLSYEEGEYFMDETPTLTQALLFAEVSGVSLFEYVDLAKEEHENEICCGSSGVYFIKDDPEKVALKLDSVVLDG